MGHLHGYASCVLRRGVIFVDLALAQMAAARRRGEWSWRPRRARHPHATVAAVAPAHQADDLDRAIQQSGGDPAHDEETDSDESDEAPSRGLLDFWPTVFALGGAVLLAFGRSREDRVPHEAIIGVVYVVAAAATVLILSKSPHGHEQMEQMLTGKLLFVDRAEVLNTAGLYAILGVLHYLFRKPFIAISADAAAAQRGGLSVRLWDCLFYAMFALMVTRSVAVGGVLVVFSFLIIPGACASMLVDSFKARVIGAWLIATVVSVCGVVLSAAGDLPTGATMVATFGVALIMSIIGGMLLRRSARTRGAPSLRA
jgi:ABC-type Mn2+/Zn2+ transport system permease subunit